MAKLELSVDNRSLKRTTSNVEDAIEDALSDAAGDVMDNAIDIGKQHIKDKEAVWRYEVLGKTMHADFDYTELTKAEKYTIWNSSRHAGIVDEGAEFDGLPNYTRLIPWVLDNLNDWHPFDYDGDDGDDGDSSVDVDPGEGLDAIASQIGTVTEEQEEEGGYVHGSDFIMESSPYDSSLFGVYTNGKVGNRTPATYDIGQAVNYRNTKDRQAQYLEGYWTHVALADGDRKEFLSQLRDRFGDDDVDSVIGAIDGWKNSTDSAEARFLEKLARGNYDIEAPLRNSQHSVDDPTEGELAVYHEMVAASQEFINIHYADNKGKVTAYRGMDDEQTNQLAAEMFNNPEADRWQFQDSVAQSYTLSEDIGDEFSQGVEVEVSFDVDDHLLDAPDFILETNDEGEIHLVGGARSFSREQIEFNGIDPDVLLSGDISKFRTDEHNAMHDIVDSIYKEEGLISDPEMSQRLTDWAAEYRRDIGDDSDIEDKIDAITVNPYPDTDDSELSFSDVTSDNIYDVLEDGDLLETEFGYFKVIDSEVVSVGWQGEEKYAIQPIGGQLKMFNQSRTDENGDPIILGTVTPTYARPKTDDPVFGIWQEHLDSGGSITHVYHKSDAPPEIETNYTDSDTIYDTSWMEEMIGGTFLVQLSDGTVVLADLHEGSNGWEFVKVEGSNAYDWYPPNSDGTSDSDVMILGLPNEAN
jgi:hypothetical protein